MVITKLLLAFLVVYLPLSASGASDVIQAFKRRDYHTVTDIYKQAPNYRYTRSELIYISYSLRQMEYYRQDIKLNVRLINQQYKDKHTKILRSIRNGDSIDSDDYPEALKVLYWNLMMNFGHIIMGYNSKSSLLESDRQYFTTFSKILSELEFRESKVDKLNDMVVAHMQYLENKIYRFVGSFSLAYVSWQSEAILNGPREDINLVVTNKGFCAGGDLGVENYLWHFYVDSCFLMGAGGIQAAVNKSNINYQQSNVPAYGLKFSPGASMIVSSSKSRIGIRFPVIYSKQNLTDPDPATGYQALNENPLSFVTTIYSRWQFKRWYFQTEFGKYLQKEQAFWGLGLGYNF